MVTIQSQQTIKQFAKFVKIQKTAGIAIHLPKNDVKRVLRDVVVEVMHQRSVVATSQDRERERERERGRERERETKRK